MRKRSADYRNRRQFALIVRRLFANLWKNCRLLKLCWNLRELRSWHWDCREFIEELYSLCLRAIALWERRSDCSLWIGCLINSSKTLPDLRRLFLCKNSANWECRIGMLEQFILKISLIQMLLLRIMLEATLFVCKIFFYFNNYYICAMFILF